jgi:molybdopterin synthase catalytic subunit
MHLWTPRFATAMKSLFFRRSRAVNMSVRLESSGLRPYDELETYQKQMNLTGVYGATVSFVGTMRDFNVGESVTEMFLEHYPRMTERKLEEIVEAVRKRWEILDLLIIHRVGVVKPGDPIVLISVWSSHRGVAFDACRETIEQLKSRAPFWKKEKLEAISRWVENNTDGY